MRDGFAAFCYPCFREAYGVGTPKHRVKRNARYRTPEGWKTHILYGAKIRARKAGVLFDLTPADIMVPASCPVLGIPLEIGGGGFAHNSPTLDRIIPALGYVRGNIEVISGLANRIKGNHIDPELFEKVAAYLREKQR